MSWLPFLLYKSSECGIKNDLFPVDPWNMKSWIFEKPSKKKRKKGQQKKKKNNHHHHGNQGARAGKGMGVVMLHTLWCFRKKYQIGVDLDKKKRPAKSSCTSEQPQTHICTFFNNATQWATAVAGGGAVPSPGTGSQRGSWAVGYLRRFSASAVPGCRAGLGHPLSRQKTFHGL